MNKWCLENPKKTVNIACPERKPFYRYCDTCPRTEHSELSYGYMPASPYADFWREHDKQHLRDKREREVLKLVEACRRVANPGEEYVQDLYRTRMFWYDNSLRRRGQMRRYEKGER